MIIMYPFLFGISGSELLVLLLLVLLLFGPKKIPEIARMIGRGLSEVKKVQREINTEIHRYSSDIQKEALDMEKSIKSDISKNSTQNNSKSIQSDNNTQQNQTHNIKGKQASEKAEHDVNPSVADSQQNENNGSEKRPENKTNNDNENELPYPYNNNQ